MTKPSSTSISIRTLPRYYSKKIPCYEETGGSGQGCWPDGLDCHFKGSKTVRSRNGSYVADGQKRCPTLAVLPAEFDRYLAATKQLYQIFNQVAPTVQIYSLDEAFIDIKRLSSLSLPRYRAVGASHQTAYQNVTGRLGDLQHWHWTQSLHGQAGIRNESNRLYSGGRCRKHWPTAGPGSI